MTRQKHIAFIPARGGSVGFPGKNRLFFDNVAEFVAKSEIFGQVIVSTDDSEIKQKSKQCNFDIHHRNEYLSGGAISIKQVAENMVEEMNIESDSQLWLLYIPVLYRDVDDFKKTKELVEIEKLVSLCSFIKSAVHPYDCWLFQ